MADSDTERGKRVMGGYKHDGSKGPKYTRWKERFLDDAEGRGDADWSMADCLQGTDGGGEGSKLSGAVASSRPGVGDITAPAPSRGGAST